MFEKVKSYIEKWNMLEKKDCVIVGVSGGADSICLLLVLLKLREIMGFRMIAVHVNHGIRGKEADADEAYVKEICEKRAVPFENYFADVELIAKNRKQSTEEAGREVRREFFEQAMQKYSGTKIALAHHQNDNAETFFINLARGTGIKGLAGIAPVKGNVIRPLLCLKREEIEEFLEEEGIYYCVDGTNAMDVYTRNRVRNHVLPYMQEQMNAKIVEHMNETMEQIRDVQDFLDEQVCVHWSQTVIEDEDEYTILADKYEGVPKALRPLLLKKALVQLCKREKDLEAVHLRQLEELFEKQVGRKVDLPYRMEGKRVYQGIRLCLKEVAEERNEVEAYFHPEQQKADFRIADKQISCRITCENLEKNNTKRFNCDIIENDICIRTRRQGDYITIHSDGRTQKIKSYFINEKIPQEERDKILLVADGSHILWIVGYRTNPIYEVNMHTKRILEIQIDEVEKNGREN